MKILALIGSHRKKGNTIRIVQLIETRMQSLARQHDISLEFETIFLSDRDIHSCRGCRVCFDRGENACPLKDDIVSIRAKMDAADGLILASPVYVDDVSGLVKTWMDRLAYVCHRPAFSGKCAFPIATVGGGPTNHTLRTMNAALLTWGFHLVGQAGFKLGALASPDEIKRNAPATVKVAESLFRAISQRHAAQPSLISLIAFKIQQLAWQREPPDSYDYAYWDGRGWLAPERTFYTSHRAHPLKVGLARWLGALLFRFVV
jgi:multimeric flavodoxin WrbA